MARYGFNKVTFFPILPLHPRLFDELISNGENSCAKDSEQCESHAFVSAGNTQTKKAAGEGR